MKQKLTKRRAVNAVLLSLCLLSCSATQNTSAATNEAPILDEWLSCTTNILIATGELISIDEKDEHRAFAECRVTERLRGQILSNTISVTYWKDSRNLAPAHNLILILTPSGLCNNIDPYRFKAVGNDFSRGLIEDTPENRNRILSTKPEELPPTTLSQWLPREKAILSVTNHMAATNPDVTNTVWFARRLGYEGWGVMCNGWKDGRPVTVDSMPLYIVDDHGVIKVKLKP